MATKKQENTVSARVLVDGAYGKCNDVVQVDESELAALAGELDADPAAVEYAQSLK
jgi:hypothetical protein